VVTSVNVRLAVPHTSFPVGVVNDGVAGQNIVVGVGSALIVGGALPTILISCDDVAVLPHASVAVQVLVTV
jgi:hypothetical protein